MSQYYYWLIPDEPHHTQLQEIINNFARVYHSPPFTPHLTIATGHSPPKKPNGFQPLKLQCTQVSTDFQYFRALYFQCPSTPELIKLRTFFGGEKSYSPHISLVYGNFSQARQKDWCSNTALYDASITFSTIWVVKGGNKVQEWKNISSFSL